MKRIVRVKSVMVSLVAVAALSACGTEQENMEADLAGESSTAPDKEDLTKPLPWGPADNPAIFGSDLQYKLADLPREGAAAQTPWAGSYWPVYQDSINVKWDGAQSESAAAKYARAFGVAGVEDAVSKYHGIDNNSSRKECSQDSECDSTIGESCGKRTGAEKGRCIPTWWGICHAWGPASMLVPEPQHEVVHNGVTFKVNDIRALATLVHDKVVNKFVSLRCNEDEAKGKIEYDELGRPKQGDCIDTNPGTLHLLMTNYLGIQQRSFVMDRTFDDEVWNQPLRAFRVTSINEVTAQEANRLIGVLPAGGTTTNLAAQVAKGAWQHFDPIAVGEGNSVKVTMSGTGDADLYVKVGARPTEQVYDCRPYTGTSGEECTVTVPAGQRQLFVSVNGYAEANVTLVVNEGGAIPAEYKFNPQARKFFEVKAELDYIGESATTLDGPTSPNIDQYTHTDRYHYVLEVDDQGRINGGEYLGESKRHHPDFLWAPQRVSQTSVAGGKIRYADVMELVNRAVVTPESGPTTPPAVVTETGTLAKNAWKHLGPYTLGAGQKLVVEMTGTGDVDLYVRKGATPTTSQYDCRPYASNSAESCTVTGAGNVFVSLHGYAATSNYTVKITTVGGTSSGGGTTPPPGPAATVHLDTSGSVTTGEMKVFTVNVLAGQQIVLRTTAPNDVDLYIQLNAAPTTGAYLARGYTNSGNETVTYMPTANGVLHVGVHGYAASTFTLKSAAN